MKNLPTISKIDGGAATLESNAFSLGNSQTLAFLFENADGAKLTVKVKASKDNGTAKAVPFVLKTVDTGETENVEADGKEIADAGAFLAIVTDRMFAHDEYDSAALSLSADTGEIGTAYALQSDPRYSGDE